MRHLHYNRTKRGFTLVETLVAITILLVGIVGPMTIAARGLQAAFHARDEVTAFSLAQEGSELMRELRDENALRSNGWLDGMGLCNSINGCGLDTRSNTPRDCNNGGTDCRLNYYRGSLTNRRGFYTYASGASTTLSPFTRQIWMTPVAGGAEAQVTVKVSWRSGIFDSVRTVTIQSRLFNQYDNL